MKKFNLSTASGRHWARKNGFDVPKLNPGKPPKEFWPQVEKTNSCWNWIGELNTYGYGLYRANGKANLVHRFVLENFQNLDLKNKVVMHICDNTKCCNPEHLAVGTHADNQLDKYKKNRQAKGEKNGESILKEYQVLEMRKKYKPRIYTYLMLAKEYGVSKDTVQKAVRGIYWKHI